ncbi:MAG: WecB/TagA/CpsF family glycosyltransferase [Defluviitaleaceae bacterium]|nr:WecB/TagA/CpsF family glycosyltransferase [Defluviitaleaceae bacterium]
MTKKNKTTILGVPVDTYTREEAFGICKEFIQGEKGYNMVITPNPEVIIKATKDAELMEIMKNAELVVPDGIGVVIASKFNKVKISERVAGCDLVESLLNFIKNTEYTAYFLGAGKGIAEEAKRKCEKKYQNIKIVGTHDGYFDQAEELKIIEELKQKKPDILLVGLGVPRQEKWIYKHKGELSVKLLIGCGGTIDVLAGAVKRAPKIFQKLGLEWFYRLLKQPSRFFRMLNLPKFVVLVLINKIRGGKK